MKIGVLALQGDFTEHQVMLEKLGSEVVQVRLPGHLQGLNGLIIGVLVIGSLFAFRQVFRLFR